MRGGALDSLTSKHILGTPFDEDVEQGWKQNSFTDVSATGGLESVIVENTEDALRNTGVKMYKLIASPDNLTPGDVIAKSEQLDKYLREKIPTSSLGTKIIYLEGPEKEDYMKFLGIVSNRRSEFSPESFITLEARGNRPPIHYDFRDQNWYENVLKFSPYLKKNVVQWVYNIARQKFLLKNGPLVNAPDQGAGDRIKLFQKKELIFYDLQKLSENQFYAQRVVDDAQFVLTRANGLGLSVLIGKSAQQKEAEEKLRIANQDLENAKQALLDAKTRFSQSGESGELFNLQERIRQLATEAQAQRQRLRQEEEAKRIEKFRLAVPEGQEPLSEEQIIENARQQNAERDARIAREVAERQRNNVAEAEKEANEARREALGIEQRANQAKAAAQELEQVAKRTESRLPGPLTGVLQRLVIGESQLQKSARELREAASEAVEEASNLEAAKQEAVENAEAHEIVAEEAANVLRDQEQEANLKQAVANALQNNGFVGRGRRVVPSAPFASAPFAPNDPADPDNAAQFARRKGIVSNPPPPPLSEPLLAAAAGQVGAALSAVTGLGAPSAASIAATNAAAERSVQASAPEAPANAVEDSAAAVGAVLGAPLALASVIANEVGNLAAAPAPPPARAAPPAPPARAPAPPPARAAPSTVLNTPQALVNAIANAVSVPLKAAAAAIKPPLTTAAAAIKPVTTAAAAAAAAARTRINASLAASAASASSSGYLRSHLRSPYRKAVTQRRAVRRPSLSRSRSSSSRSRSRSTRRARKASPARKKRTASRKARKASPKKRKVSPKKRSASPKSQSTPRRRRV